MTLENGRKPVRFVFGIIWYGLRRKGRNFLPSRVGRKTKSMKYVDKQCPRFSTKGALSSG